jgi:hypothetical protein
MPETSSSGTSIRRHARNRFFLNLTFSGMERVYRTILARSSQRDTNGTSSRSTRATPGPGKRNPSHSFPGGFPTTALGIFVPAGFVNSTNYNVNRLFNTIWMGGKYDIWSNLTARVGFL